MNSIDEKMNESPTNAPDLESQDKPAPEPESKEPEHIDPELNESEESNDEDESDEYGNEVVKTEKKSAKTYTEEQVQAMIRDRLSRGKHAEEPEPATKPQSKDFEYDADSSQSWEQQLEGFMDGWASKREQKEQQKQQQQKEQAWRAAEQEKQVEFESKFNSGMSKYKDFNEVVGSAPIDDTMFVATRGMKDPAAFIYAASKKQPAELKRISQIQDPYAKMMEMGRLDERMKKERTAKSSAPKPATRTKGDSSGNTGLRSIDDRIAQYANKHLRK